MRAILIITLILSPLVGMSQTVLFTGSPSMLTYHKGALGADSILKIPFADTTGVGSLWPDSLRKGAIMVNSADTMLYYHDGNGWRVVGSADTDTNFIRNQGDYDQAANSRISGINVSGRALVGNEFGHLDSAQLVAWNYMSSLFSVIGSTYPRTPGDHHIDAVSLRLQGDFSENTPSPQTWYSASGQALRFGAKASPNTDRLTMNAMDIEAPTIGSLSLPPGAISIWNGIHIYGMDEYLADSSHSKAGVVLDMRLTPTTSSKAKKFGYVSTSMSEFPPAPNFFGGKTVISKDAINDLLPGAPILTRTPGPSMDTFSGDFSLKILGNMVYKNGDEGDGKILTSSADGTVNIVDAGSIIPDGAFVQDGNAFGETAVLGTTDNEALELIAGGNTALRVNPNAKVQYLDGTEGDGKILMSSSDGTLSAQSRDSVMNGVWRSGIVNSMGTHATLRTSADTITIMNASGSPAMQSVGSRLAFNDIVRGNVDGFRLLSSAPSTGGFGLPIVFDARFPTGATGNRIGTLLGAAGSTPTRISVLSIGRSALAGPTWVGIIDDNWGGIATATNYFMRATTFQPSSTNWFLYTDNPVKSQLPGNLLLGATSDNGHKLQVSGSIYGRNQSEPFNQFIMAESFTPTGTADASGEVGSMAWDDDYIYIKTSDGWKRSTLSTF